MAFADKVEKILQASGDSQKEFLEQINNVGGLCLQRNFFTRMTTTDPSIKTLVAICKVYKVSPEWLLDIKSDGELEFAISIGISKETARRLKGLNDIGDLRSIQMIEEIIKYAYEKRYGQ